MGQCWEFLSGLGQHSWDISAPFLFIQLPQQMTLCYWPCCDGQQVGQLLALAAMELSSVRDGDHAGRFRYIGGSNRNSDSHSATGKAGLACIRLLGTLISQITEWNLREEK